MRILNLLHTLAGKVGTWLSFFLLLATAAHSQQGKVSIASVNPTVKEVMVEIRRQTGYLFAFDGRSFDVGRSVHLSPNEAALAGLLDAITLDDGLEWRLLPPYIVICKGRPKPISKPVPVAEIPAAKVETETFVVPSHEPLAGAMLPAPVAELPRRPLLERRNAVGPTAKHLLPRVGIKTNALWSNLALTPNIGIEVGVNAHSTIEFTGGWISHNRAGRQDGSRTFGYCLGRAEYRYWFRERYKEYFIGLHVLGVKYDIGGYNVPTMFSPTFRYDGWALGTGLTLGYGLRLAPHLGLEFHFGLGMIGYTQTRFSHTGNMHKIDHTVKVWVGPTNAGVNFSILMGK